MRVLIISLGVLLASGCSNSSVPDPLEPSASTESASESDQEELTLVPESLLLLEDEPGLLAELPDVVASETLANSGLQVAYTDPGQILAIPALSIEAQWLSMQSCLGQTAIPPLVVVRSGPVTPFTSEDDVIHSIDGIPVASTSVRVSAIMQVRDIDFDGSIGQPGFNLRSIMGRYLWLSANLPEREYPYNCARQQP